jgi:cytochrome c
MSFVTEPVLQPSGLARALSAGLALAAAGVASGAVAGDPARGAIIWSGQCAMCHAVDPAAEARVGPHLAGLIGRPLGGVEDFAGYSGPMILAGIDGAVWDEERLRRFLDDPYAMFPDTRMGFGGLHDPVDLADLLAWLVPATQGEIGPAPGFRLPAEVLAIEGDAEYGEYLASECTTCHQRDGGADGIPSITGWPEDGFVTVMHAYRERVRPNVTMQTITARLGDEEIAALAAYFATLQRGAN